MHYFLHYGVWHIVDTNTNPCIVSFYGAQCSNSNTFSFAIFTENAIYVYHSLKLSDLYTCTCD